MKLSVMDQPLWYHSVASCPLQVKDSSHMDKFSSTKNPQQSVGKMESDINT